MGHVTQYKKSITDFLTEYLEVKKTLLKEQTWATDAITRLQTFAIQGKMLRGSLVHITYSLWKKTKLNDVLKVAAALELFQSALLIHDDIMDEDALRRGKPTIFAQYQTFAEEKKLPFPRHFGESMGICIGDIGFFLGFDLLSTLTYDVKEKIISLVSTEFTNVGLAQMQDVFNGMRKDQPTEEEILEVYKYKTGRYTFSLPMMLGAILAKQDARVIKQLEKLGENLGIIFQLRDDNLGLFGDISATGKPVGSDINQNKKTLYYIYLFKAASSNQKKILAKIFKKPHKNPGDIAEVIELIHLLAIEKKVDKKMNILIEEAKKDIAKLPVSLDKKNEMNQLLAFSYTRKK